MSVIVSAAGNKESLFSAVREFQTEKVVLVAGASDKAAAEDAKKALAGFGISAEIVHAEGDIWEGTFRVIHGISKANQGKDILINVSSGGDPARCAMTCAAFVNGLKAFSVNNGKISMLPVLKFSYYKLITDRKMRILEALYKNPGCCTSLEQLSEKCGMSLPLASYHVNGSPKSAGLREMALIETSKKDGKVHIGLSVMGRILMGGYVESE